MEDWGMEEFQSIIPPFLNSCIPAFRYLNFT
jgi:hypothetical protein